MVEVTKEEKNRPIVLSLISSRGGTGKTTIAINMACELGIKANSSSVLLVDCDIYNRGATLWLCKKETQNNSSSSSLANLLAEYNSFQSINANVDLKIIDGPAPNENRTGPSFRFLPAILIDPAFENKNLESVQNSVTKCTEFMNKLIEYATKQNTKFLILDCHPGPVPLSIACCHVSDCMIIVSDGEVDTLRSSILLAWRIEEEIYKIDSENSSKLHKWRVAMNRLPSKDSLREKIILKKIRDAVTSAKEVWEKIKQTRKVYSQNFDQFLIGIPDLEEMRIEDTDNNTANENCLSPRRRGGNAMILSVKAMLRKLGKDKLLGNNLSEFRFSKDDNDELFEKLPIIYHPSRGLGNTGLTSLKFFLLIAYQCLFITYLVFDYVLFNKLPMIVNLSIGIFYFVVFSLSFFLALWVTWKLIGDSRKQYDSFIMINGYKNLKPRQKYSLYNEGGDPNTTTAVWWPRFVWLIAFFPPFLVVLIKYWTSLKAFYAVLIALGLGSIWQIIPFIRDKIYPDFRPDIKHFYRCVNSAVFADRKHYRIKNTKLTNDE